MYFKLPWMTLKGPFLIEKGKGILSVGDSAQQIFADISDTFFVRKMQLLGGQRPPQDLLDGQRPSKSCIFLTKNVSD